jgi:hypothetical protein
MASSPNVARTDLSSAPPRSPAAAMAGTLTVPLVGYLLLLVAALLARPIVFLVGVAVVLTAELVLRRRTPFVRWVLASTGLGPILRLLLRGLLAVTVLAGCGADRGALTLAVVGWVALVGLAATGHASADALAWLRTVPVLSRNLDLAWDSTTGSRAGSAAGSGAIPGQPRALLAVASWLPLADLPLLVGAGLAARVGAADSSGHAWLVGGLIVGVLPSVAVVGALAGALSALRSASPRTRLPAAIQAAVERLGPDVVLFHSGDARSAYQLDAWTSVLERIGRPALVVVRHQAVLRALGPTTLPVVCIGPASSMVNFGLGRARVAFLVGNGRGNIHLFRRHGLSFVFLGHGDSDKATSATPLARVYDQIWVAGPAATERYARAGVRLVPGAIVEIGRPQLADLGSRAVEADPSRRTVLYAPTWEGWGDEQYVASLAEVGVPLVRRLLAEPGVRVVYRPHPLTGTRDRSLLRADREIRALLIAAGAQRGPGLGASTGGGSADLSADDLQVCLDDGGPAGVAGVRAAAARRASELWGSVRHLVIEDGWPDLLDCFAHADLLVSDISALLSDWLATGRPYVVLNPAGGPVSGFVQTHPSAAGATLVGPTLAELEPVLTDLHSGADPQRLAREALAGSVLGPRPPDPLAPLRSALDSLLAGD